MPHLLQPHPSTDHHPLKWLQVEAIRVAPSSLRLCYQVAGAMGDIVWPSHRGPIRTDGLWRHTCFELFLRADDGPEYLEFNFAPSLGWAAYIFANYRDGQREAPDLKAPKVRFLGGTEGATLTATIEHLPTADWHLNLAAVIEEEDGTKSYWALVHPAGEPDFHHPDCFVLELPAASAA